AVAFRRRAWADRLFQLVVLAGCLVSGAAALTTLVSGADLAVTVRAAVPGGDWAFGIDRLSAVFLVAILTVGAAATAYGTSYLAAERSHRAVWFVHATLAVLLVAMALVVTARAVVPFLAAWEVMAITSYLLIVTEHEKAEARRSGLIYLVATHTGTLALLAMFAAWSVHTRDWSFAALAAAPALPASGAAILLLALLGFGFKAGIVPLHFWLPPAHSAAPTHVSALLSGVVIKTGVYGLLRVVSLLGGAPAWWGWLILALGIGSGVLGVLWALAQHDIKRLLAYHSVENIGIIAMGIGVGALGGAYHEPAIAIIGYAGALLHTVNHALFKSLLFLGAGAVARASGTRSLDRLGGLVRRMPITWIAFLVGATAIVGLPPLNGFVSEWLVFQGLFRAGQSADRLRFAALGVPALGLIGALALACFAKAAGVVFLGRARSDEADRAREAEPGLLQPMLALAAACVLFGVAAPAVVIPALDAAASLGGLRTDSLPELPVLATDATWIGVLAAATLAVVGAMWIARGIALRGRMVRSDETWACGYATADARMQYTASSFAAPLLAAFGRLSGVREQRDRAAFETHPMDLVLDRAALPAWHAIQRAALRLRPMQRGRLYAYLMYVTAALVALLFWLALGPQP
ncbi:MAG TPA: proton-conducting transporter membrane subunit, partial [Gemmatimonadales bacterium]|nr:proton-conducting transporter membrane subunit [Gemmatimonadales bacterium]